MSLQVCAFYCTDTGRRPRNEDAVGLSLPGEPELPARGMIAAIADGVSGSADGREAAEYAISAVLTAYGARASEGVAVIPALDESFQTIHRAIRERNALRAESVGMATTLTTLVIQGHAYYFCHVGDTRLYRLRRDDLELLTTDHVADGASNKHVLTRAIGQNSAITMDHGAGDLDLGDIFLLASDGIWSVLPEHEISWHLSELIGDKRSAEGTARLLVDAALAAGSTDNLSALVVRIDQLPDQ